MLNQGHFRIHLHQLGADQSGAKQLRVTHWSALAIVVVLGLTMVVATMILILILVAVACKAVQMAWRPPPKPLVCF